MAKSKKAGMGNGEKMGIGVALTTAAMAAAGAYFLYASPNAAKNRKKVKSWMLKARGEVLEVMEKAGKMTAEEYQAAVEQIAAGYAQVQNISKADISEFKKDMMANWQKISKLAGGAKKTVKKEAKKVAKKVTKEVKKATK